MSAVKKCGNVGFGVVEGPSACQRKEQNKENFDQQYCGKGSVWALVRLLLLLFCVKWVPLLVEGPSD